MRLQDKTGPLGWASTPGRHRATFLDSFWLLPQPLLSSWPEILIVLIPVRGSNEIMGRDRAWALGFGTMPSSGSLPGPFPILPGALNSLWAHRTMTLAILTYKPQGSNEITALDKDTGLIQVMHARGTSGSAKRICCIGK